MRISDWSSGVRSSDLHGRQLLQKVGWLARCEESIQALTDSTHVERSGVVCADARRLVDLRKQVHLQVGGERGWQAHCTWDCRAIGRESCRETGWEYGKIWEVAVVITKKKRSER